MRLKDMVSEGSLTRDAERGINKTSAHKFTIDVDARDGSVEELTPRIVAALSAAGIRAEVEGKEGFRLESQSMPEEKNWHANTRMSMTRKNDDELRAFISKANSNVAALRELGDDEAAGKLDNEISYAQMELAKRQGRK